MNVIVQGDGGGGTGPEKGPDDQVRESKGGEHTPYVREMAGGEWINTVY